MDERTMMTSDFNLTDDKWIPVNTIDGRFEELSMKELFKNADGISDIACTSSIEQVSVFRFLLSVVYDWAQNTEYRDQLRYSSSEAWKETYANRVFVGMDDYLESHRDLFWFTGNHDRLFGQVKSMLPRKEDKDGNPEWKGVRSFMLRPFGGGKVFTDSVRKSVNIEPLPLSIPEALRSVISIDAFDVKGLHSSYKGSDKSKLSAKASTCMDWTQMYMMGNTLFETLMRNFISADSDTFKADKSIRQTDHAYGVPSWRSEDIHPSDFDNKGDGDVPHTILEALTWRSRSIRIHMNDEGLVDGALISIGRPLNWMKGSSVSKVEPMCIWRRMYANQDKDKVNPITRPRAIRTEMFGWDILPSIVAVDSLSGHADFESAPLVLKWNKEMSDVIGTNHVNDMRVCNVLYGNQNAVISDSSVSSFSLPFRVMENDRLIKVALDAVSIIVDSKTISGKKNGVKETVIPGVAYSYGDFVWDCCKALRMDKSLKSDKAAEGRSYMYRHLRPLYDEWLSSMTSYVDDSMNAISDFGDVIKKKAKVIEKAAMLYLDKWRSMVEKEAIDSGNNYITSLSEEASIGWVDKITDGKDSYGVSPKIKGSETTIHSAVDSQGTYNWRIRVLTDEATHS